MLAGDAGAELTDATTVDDWVLAASEDEVAATVDWTAEEEATAEAEELAAADELADDEAAA